MLQNYNGPTNQGLTHLFIAESAGTYSAPGLPGAAFQLAEGDAIAVDKDGTVTSGKPEELGIRVF